MQEQTLIPHLFRSEFSKIVAVLCKHFGFVHVEIAEDIASDTFLAAFETWTYKGIPENPKAWLYAVAKNKAKNYLQRNTNFIQKISAELLQQDTPVLQKEIDLSETNIRDSVLQMMFAICHPSISPEAQIGLSLRILCGFGIDEIATALLSNKETINKRLFRAKEKLREEKVKIEFPGIHEIENRLETVLTTLYLLYNEGYYSESRDRVIREDLCMEAMRLTKMLIDNESTNQPNVNALYSLMCFQSSRFPARMNSRGEIIFYQDQDESLWNQELITNGAFYLHQASKGTTYSKYHLEAGIAYWHTIKADTKEKWENILNLFDRLLLLDYTPIAALNRIYVFSKVYGKEKAIPEAEQLGLNQNHFYFTLLGDLYTQIDKQKAKLNFEKALELAKTKADKHTIREKIGNLL